MIPPQRAPAGKRLIVDEAREPIYQAVNVLDDIWNNDPTLSETGPDRSCLEPKTHGYDGRGQFCSTSGR
jgi:hypothetical protein